MKEELNDDFLEQIKKVLLNHEEAYDEGAWERFREKEEKKVKPVVPIWRWAAAAAAVLAGIVLTWTIYNSNTKSLIPLQGNKNALVTNEPSKDSNKIINPITDSTRDQQIPVAPILNDRNIATYPANQSQKEVILSQAAVEQTSPGKLIIAAPQPQPSQQQQMANATQEPQTKKPFYENNVVIADQGEIAKQQPASGKTLPATTAQPKPDYVKVSSPDVRKWQSSVYLSPTFGDLGINMGYGYSIGYAINSKVKISSGIAYNKASASRSFDVQSAPSPIAADAVDNTNLFASRSYAPVNVQSLQSVQGTVSGIDIPLDVNYNINKKMYATAGVSGFVILNDKRVYTVVDSRNERTVVKSKDGVIKEDNIQNFSNTSKTTEPLLPGSSERTPFLGFYNVSLGYKQKISNKNAISVEPFLKVPMKNVTKESLNYTGAGVRLKFDF